MGIRIFRIEVERMQLALSLFPSSVRVIGTAGGAPIGQCAFVLESSCWPDDPPDTQPREVRIKVDDSFKLRRVVTLEDASPIVKAGAEAIIVPRRG